MTGCNYHGQMFGNAYPDACCIDGYLWNEDSGWGTDDGWAYDSGGEIPCPNCNQELAIGILRDDLRNDGGELFRKPRLLGREATRRVKAHASRMRERWGFFGDARLYRAE